MPWTYQVFYVCVCVGLGCSYWYDVHPLHTCTLISPPPLPAPASEPAQASTFAMMMTMVLSKFAPDEGVFIDFLTGSGISTEGCASTWPSVEKWSSSGSQEDVKSEYFSKEGWAAWLAAVTEKDLTLQGLGWEAAAPVAEVKAAAPAAEVEAAAAPAAEVEAAEAPVAEVESAAPAAEVESAEAPAAELESAAVPAAELEPAATPMPAE